MIHDMPAPHRLAALTPEDMDNLDETVAMATDMAADDPVRALRFTLGQMRGSDGAWDRPDRAALDGVVDGPNFGVILAAAIHAIPRLDRAAIGDVCAVLAQPPFIDAAQRRVGARLPDLGLALDHAGPAATWTPAMWAAIGNLATRSWLTTRADHVASSMCSTIATGVDPDGTLLHGPRQIIGRGVPRTTVDRILSAAWHAIPRRARTMDAGDGSSAADDGARGRLAVAGALAGVRDHYIATAAIRIAVAAPPRSIHAPWTDGMDLLVATVHAMDGDPEIMRTAAEAITGAESWTDRRLEALAAIGASA